MPKDYIPKAALDKLNKAFKGYCEYCRYLKKFTSARFHNDHIIPIAFGGLSIFENLAKACSYCNGEKYTAISGFDPITHQTVPLFHPRQDDWHEHFKWSDYLLRMEGLTPIGRATIIVLDTNNQEIINLRSVLIGHGHPPK